MTWRNYAVVILLAMSLIDLGTTFYYVNTYKAWQPEKSFNLIEQNPLLVFLWNNLGFIVGMLVGSIIILTLIFLVAKSAHYAVVGLLFLFLCYALINHYFHITMLQDLITKYPLGHI